MTAATTGIAIASGADVATAKTIVAKTRTPTAPASATKTWSAPATATKTWSAQASPAEAGSTTAEAAAAKTTWGVHAHISAGHQEEGRNDRQ